MNISKLAFFALAALASGCDDDDDDINGDGDGDGNGDGNGDPTPQALEWRATLEPTELYTTINGDASVRMNIGEASFTASITIRDDETDSVRPWHVHVGTCGSGGAIVGPDDAYPRLDTGGDGAAMEEVQIRVGLDQAAPYHVNVHYSDDMLARIIACGDLMLQE